MFFSFARFLGTAFFVIFCFPLLAQIMAPLNLLPFETDFSSQEGYAPGTQVQDPAWGFEEGLLPEVIDSGDGTFALRFQAPGRLVFAADPDAGGDVEAPVIWVNLSIRPATTPLNDPAALEVSELWVDGNPLIRFGRNIDGGILKVFDGSAPEEAQWKTSVGPESLDASGAFLTPLQLSLRIDYADGSWDLYVNGELNNLRLALPAGHSAGFDRVAFTGDADASSELRQFYAGAANPLFPDSSNDGIPDDWYLTHGLQPATSHRFEDPDRDGLSNLQEYLLGTHPVNPDTDGDGIDDGTEGLLGTDPLTGNAFSLGVLPFVDGFETDLPGLFVTGTRLWSLVGGMVEILNAPDAPQASQYLQQMEGQEASTLSRFFDVSQSLFHPAVFVDMNLKVGYRGDEDLEAVEDYRRASAFYVNTDGLLRVLHGNSNGGGQWITLDHSPLPAGDWARFTLYLDYQSQTWSIWVDGVRQANHLGFRDPVPAFSLVQFDRLLALDGFQAGPDEPAGLDNDGDGLLNTEERALGADVDNPDSSGDGMADGDKVIHGLDPLQNDPFVATLQADGQGGFHWHTDFSTAEGFVPGPLDGQDHWQAIHTDHTGLDSVRFSTPEGNASLQRMFGTHQLDRLWLSFRARLQPGSLPEVPDDQNRPLALAFGYTTPSTLAMYNTETQQWMSYAVETDAREWNDYVLHLDYRSRELLFLLNGRLIDSGIPHHNHLGSTFTRLRLLRESLEEGGDPAIDPVNDFELDRITLSTTEPSGLDFSGDGMTNDEKRALGLDPWLNDNSGDGLPDVWKIAHGFDPHISDANDDLDGDELTNLDEYTYGTNPHLRDSDGDQLDDFEEIFLLRTDPLTSEGPNFLTLTDYQLDGIDHGLKGAAFKSYGPNPRYYLMGSGIGIRQAKDSGHYLHRTITGDFTYTVQFHRLDGDQQPTFSIMARDSLEDAGAMVAAHCDNSFRTFYMYQRGLAGDDAPFRPGKRIFQHKRPEVWLRMVRTGNTLYSYASQDGISWYLIGTTGVSGNQTMELGVFASSGSLTNRVFCEFSVIELRTDADRDGIWDDDEYGFATSATEWDSDGDGYSDYDEIHELHSDPTFADLGGVTVVDSQDGSASVATLGDWVTDGGATYALGGRGAVEYDLFVEEAAIYRLNLRGKSRFNHTGYHDYGIKVEIDGVYIGRIRLQGLADVAKNGHILTPWLPEGVHRVRFYIDNTYTYRSLQIDEVFLEYIGGDDLDQDGTPDWMQFRLAANNGLTNAAPGALTESRVSPFCLTGRSRYLGLSHAVDSVHELHPLPVFEFYADVPLSSTGDTELNIQFENDAFSEVLDLRWVATDVLSTDSIILRKGDRLLLTALDSANPSDQPISITINNGDQLIGSESQPVEVGFETVGPHTVEATVGGLTGTLVINVLEADLGDGAYELLINKLRTLTPPALSYEAGISVDETIHLDEDLVPTPRRLHLTALEPEPSYLAARLPENGPVLGHLKIQPFYLVSDNETHVSVVETFEDGDQLISTNIVLDHVPDDLEVTISIFVSGVTFSDGSIVKNLTAEDFDELGRATVFFIKPAGTSTSVCHRIFISYDGEAPGSL